MKFCIRRNVFETNSSSMHSIAISKSSGYYSEEEIKESLAHNDKKWGRDKQGNFNIVYKSKYNDDWAEELSFGRAPFDILCTFGDKLKYVFAAMQSEWDDAAYKNFIDNELCKYLPFIKSVTFPKVSASYKVYHTNQNYVYGSIDHQSIYVFRDFIKTKKISIMEFLKNRKYIVIIDGDEYGVSEQLVKSNIIELEEPLYRSSEEGGFSYVEG